MRGYIFSKTNGPRRPIYSFTGSSDASLALGEHLCQLIEEEGITIEQDFGAALPCTDFRKEPHPRGGFALSCEVP